MPTPNKIVLTYRDNSNKRATSEHYIDPTPLLAQQTQAALAFALLVDNVIAARVSDANVVVDIDISGLAQTTPLAGADVEEVGEFISRSTSGHKAIMNLPGIESNATGVGTDDLDRVDTGIAAIISALEDGIVVTGGVPIVPCDAGGDDLVSVDTARERVRNSGKRA